MPKKILIVDDEKDWVRMLATRLFAEGYEVSAAFDAIQATSQIKEMKPDIVLLDIMMPAGGGMEVLRNLRNNIRTFTLPVIIVTAKSDDKTRDETAELGISDYFVKSFGTDELLKKIKEVIR